jgi:hypothetical protein
VSLSGQFRQMMRSSGNTLRDITKRFSKETLLGILILGFLVTVFALVPIPTGVGDDWETFKGSSERILTGTPLYGERVTHAYYSNPPWLAVLLIPLSLLPFQWGWSILCVTSLVLIVLLCRSWQIGPWKTVLVLMSPATFYLLLHGEIDALVIAGLLLPKEMWFVVAATKPQVAIGLVLGVGRERIIKAIGITLLLFLLTLPFFGFWPLQIIQQPTPFIDAAHNLWIGLWPFQVPAGVGILLLGIRRKDERFLIAASPFLSPYAATSSLLGPWMALASLLKGWEATIVFVTWWGSVIYRLLGF